MARHAKDALLHPPREQSDDVELELDYQLAELLAATDWHPSFHDLQLVPARVVELFLEIKRGESDLEAAQSKAAPKGEPIASYRPEHRQETTG